MLDLLVTNATLPEGRQSISVAVRDGRIQRGQLVLLEAFGGGFTWGSALLRY